MAVAAASSCTCCRTTVTVATQVPLPCVGGNHINLCASCKPLLGTAASLRVVRHAALGRRRPCWPKPPPVARHRSWHREIATLHGQACSASRLCSTPLACGATKGVMAEEQAR